MAVVTNLFDIPRNRVVMYYPLGGGSGILAKVDATLEVDTWIEPNFIDAWFITEGFTSPK